MKANTQKLINFGQKRMVSRNETVVITDVNERGAFSDMSIYPVRLAEWFPPGDENHDIMKFIVSVGYCDGHIGCLYCGKKHMHWQEAIGHHSLPWGYGDIWCREKCYRNYLKKRYKKFQKEKKK